VYKEVKIMFRLKKQAQSTLEYAILIFVIVAALITMQIYIKRGMMGRLRSSTDEIGEQYSAGHTTGSYDSVRETATTEKVGLADDGATRADGVTKRIFNKDEAVRRGGETIEPLAVDN
jgi:hypothetical protein